MCSRVGNAQINNHMHKSQNENHGLSGTTLTVPTRAIDMVILNKNIPINQHTGHISQSNKKGRDEPCLHENHSLNIIFYRTDRNLNCIYKAIRLQAEV